MTKNDSKTEVQSVSSKSRIKVPFSAALMSTFIILFILGIIFTYYAMLYNETRERIIKNGEISAVSSAEKVDKYISSGVDTLKLVSYTLDNMIRSGKTQEEFADYLSAETTALDNITSINSTGFYGYINGEYIDGSGWKPDEGYDPVSRPWYVEAMANGGKVAVVDPYIDSQTNTLMVTFSKTLCDVKSVAALDFSITRLQTIIQKITTNGDSDIEIVLNRKYQVIAHSDKGEVGKSYLTEKDTLGGAIVNELRVNSKSNFSVNFGDTEYIVYAVTVSNDWICLSVSNATSAFAQLQKTLVFTIIAVLLVTTVLLIILIRFNRRQAAFKLLSMHVVEALAAAIDAKDPYTNGHSGRVAEYSKEMGKRFGYSAKKQEELYMMGLLHDVGKIGIPDAVINKPGRLTDEEFTIIKTHPSKGAYILSKTSEIPRMAVGAHWHHERYDGRGYPDGLSGKAIPEEARIIAVADTYDAMTSKRSYRDVLAQEIVRAEIEKGKGTQFDPDFADIMLRMIDEDTDFQMKGR